MEEGVGQRTEASFTETGKVERQKRQENEGSGVQLLVFSSGGPWRTQPFGHISGDNEHPKIFYKWKEG